MRAPKMLAVSLAWLATVCCLAGQDRPASLPARTVTLAKDDIDVADALAAISKQTGTEVVDRRSVKGKVSLRLNLDKATFWQGLDTIARQADARLSLYQDDGRVALVNGPYRPVPASTQGIFRSTVRRLAAARNLETGGDSCTIELETAWELWFRPFLMEVGPATARYAGPMKRPVAANIPGQGRARLAGRVAITELRLPAPPRAVQKIDSLQGSFKLIGPTKMLSFRFDDLKTTKQSLSAQQDGVKVEVTRMAQDPDKWSFAIVINNPSGGPTYESHQAHLWLENNRIWLQKGEGKSAVVWMPPPEAEGESDKVTESRANVVYTFPLRHRTTPSRVGKLADWSLHYTTPGPIVETKVDFAFTDLPLP